MDSVFKKRNTFQVVPKLFPMKKNDYHPISCDYYDELTLLAMRRTKCPVIYKNTEGVEVTNETVIKDIFTRNSEEFILLLDGSEIRLDHIVSVNGIQLEGYC